MKQIIRKSIAEEVAETLKERIVSGTLAINEQLPTEPELMTAFGVGRSSIREAIKILAQSGFIKVQQGLGTFVISQMGHNELDTKIGQANYDEAFEVRQVLELKIIEKACQFCNEKDIEIIRHHLEERGNFANQGELDKCIKADIAFHTKIAESCGNSILTELYKTLSKHVEKSFYDIYMDTTPFINSQNLHGELLKSIENHKPKKGILIAEKIIGNRYE